MLLLLTYRLTWASTSASGSFVGHVCKGWMPKDREDLAFHRRVCAIWLPQDPFVRGSISGPGGCSAVLKQRGWERHWEQRRTGAQCWPVWPLLPGGQPISNKGWRQDTPKIQVPHQDCTIPLLHTVTSQPQNHPNPITSLSEDSPGIGVEGTRRMVSMWTITGLFRKRQHPLRKGKLDMEYLQRMDLMAISV